MIFENRSIERILFFLLINKKAYPTKMARHFNSAVTPFQQGFLNLEQKGIVNSYKEGKVRFYQFNQEGLFYHELEALLRKLFTLLPLEDKKNYYDPDFIRKKEPVMRKNNLILKVWEKMGHLKNLSLTTTTAIGSGKVDVSRHGDNVIIFEETGSWVSHEGETFKFTNSFRWTLDRFENLITLEHLRFGKERPVFLFHLAETAENTLESVSSYVCKADTYLGQVRCSDHYIKLNWRIIGPSKNEEIDYVYT